MKIFWISRKLVYVIDMTEPEPESERAYLEQAELEEFYSIGTYVTSFLVIIGTVGAVGNIHVLLVYFKWMRHTTYRVFVMALSLTDLLGSTLSIAFVILELRHPLLFSSSELCKISRMVIYFVATFSLCLLDIISLERLWLICRPLGYHTGTTAAIFICLVCAACTFCLVSIPAGFIYGSDQRPTSLPTLVGCECTVTGYLRRPILGIIYQLALASLFAILLVTCITTYGYIYRKLKRVLLKDSNLRVHSFHQYTGHYHEHERTTVIKKRSKRSESTVEILSETLENSEIPEKCENSEQSEISEKCENSEQSEIPKHSETLGRSFNLEHSENFEHPDISTTSTECAKQLQNETDTKYLEINPDLCGKTSPDLGIGREKAAGFRDTTQSYQTTTLCSRGVSKTIDGHDVGIPAVHVRSHQTLRKAVSTTRMFLVISAASFFTSLPYFVLAALRNLNWDAYFDFDENFGSLDEFLTSLMFLNHVINPIIYGFMDKKFRKGCVQMYRRVYKLVSN